MNALSRLGVKKNQFRHTKSQSLLEAFESFTQETLRLEKSYQELEKEFKQLQGELKENLITLESIVSHMAQGLIFIRADGIIALLNPYCGVLLGINPKEAVGNSYTHFFSDELFGFSLKKFLNGGLAPSVVCLLLEKSQQTLEIEVSSTRLPKGKGVILLLRDLTEVRFLEKAAKRGERLKELGEMAAGLAHEIRNPLAGIEGYAALLERDLKKERPDLAQKSQAIIDGTRSLNRLVTNVLQYSRPLKPQFQIIDLNDYIENVLSLLGAEKKSYRKRLVFDSSTKTCFAQIDPDAIRLALFNLLLNALQASPKGLVKVKLSMKKNAIFISIIDSGPGMDAEQKEKIFTPFFTTKEGGTGLGLSEVHKVIEAHNGSIIIDSQLGVGSTFSIKLPILRTQRLDGYRESTHCRR